MISQALKTLSFFFGLIAFLILGLMIYQSFLGGPFFETPLLFTMESYINTLRDPGFYRALIGSLVIAALTLLAVPIALFISISVHKFAIPGRSIIEPLILAPMFIPPLVWGFAWLYAYGPIGILPKLWGDVYGLVPAGILSALVHVPNAYVIISTSLLGIDSSYEEVARIHGARAVIVVLRILIPMIRPAIVFSAIILLVLGFEQFGIPLLLYTTVGGEVLTTYIYRLHVLSITPSYPKEAVVASVLIYITVSLILFQRYLTMKYGKRFAVIGSRVKGIGRIEISKPWRVVLLVLISIYLVFVVIIPLGSLVMRSLNPLYGGRMSGITWDYYITIFSSEYHRQTIINTIEVAAIAATLGAITALGYSLAILRSKRASVSRFFDAASTLPRSMPGIVIGLAFLWFFLFTPLRPLIYTPLGLAIAYVVAWSIMGTRVIVSSMSQLSPELEEVARIHGASSSLALRRIIIPIIKRSVLIAWLVMFIYAIRDYSIATFLVMPQTMVIGSFLVMSYGAGEMSLISALSSVLVFMILVISAVIFRLGWKPYG
ncbi:MAG TPA: iron ABC transporter permease [Sulfolobales archaeon]|nr:iron ABC transporter permease [Sulfolobales archaeon]